MINCSERKSGIKCCFGSNSKGRLSFIYFTSLKPNGNKNIKKMTESSKIIKIIINSRYDGQIQVEIADIFVHLM